MNIKETLIPELKRFCRVNFNVDEIFSRASELKYSNEIRVYFAKQLSEPSDDFVKFMLSNVYDGVKTSAVIEKYRPVIKNTLNNLVNEMMNDRIMDALKKDVSSSPPTNEQVSAPEPVIETAKSAINTTDEELQAFYIVKAILNPFMDVENINYKDTLSYCSVLYNGMVTKWICRFRFGESKKYVCLPNEAGDEARSEISSIDGIYKLSDVIIKSAQRFTTKETPR